MTSIQSGSPYEVDLENISSTPPRRPPLPSCYIMEDTKFRDKSRVEAEDNRVPDVDNGSESLFVTKNNNKTKLVASESNSQCDVERLQYWFESCDDGDTKSSHNMVHYENFLSKIEDFVNQMHSFTEVLSKISNHMIKNQRNTERTDDCKRCQLIHGSQTASRETSQRPPPITVKSENRAKMPKSDTQSRNEMSPKTSTQFELIKHEKSEEKEIKGMVKKISFSSCKNNNSDSSSKDLLKTYTNKSSQCNFIMNYVQRNTSSESHSNSGINNGKFSNRRKSHRYTESKTDKTVPAKFECCSCDRTKYYRECNTLGRYPGYENYSQHETPTSWSQHPFVHFSDGYQFFRFTRNESNMNQSLPDSYFSVAQGGKQMLGKPLWNMSQ